MVARMGYMDSAYYLDVYEAVYTWVQNQNTGAPSRYENFDFHSFARFGQDYLAATDDGIYLLEGDSDNGTAIDASAVTGSTDFGDSRSKRVLGAYMGLASAGQTHLTLLTDGERTTGPFQLRVSATAGQVERTKLQKGIKSGRWQFKLENFEGSDLELTSLELEVMLLTGRLKR